MDKFSEVILQFEGFIKRSILPSSSFVFFLLLYDILINQQSIIQFFDKAHTTVTISLFILAFIGFSNLLSLLQQGIYDNRLKDNFDTIYFWKEENHKLQDLREKVKAKLDTTDTTDYILYKNIAKGEKTKQYVDQAKSMGILFISLMLITLLIIFSLFYHIVFIECSYLFLVMNSILIFLVIIEYLIGKEFVISRYRSRAIQIYTNNLQSNINN